jgi:hypothetical protein
VTKKIIGQDLVKLTRSSDPGSLLTILAWGDEIEVVGEGSKSKWQFIERWPAHMKRSLMLDS